MGDMSLGEDSKGNRKTPEAGTTIKDWGGSWPAGSWVNAQPELAHLPSCQQSPFGDCLNQRIGNTNKH